MAWDLKSDRPIYAQLLEIIKLRIVTGEYAPGEKLPSVRELAAEAAVNPNTMQKALTQLEAEELVFAVRTTGRYITENTEKIKTLKDEMAAAYIKGLFWQMRSLGFSREETYTLIGRMINEGREV